MKKFRISAVIPTYNSWITLRNCIKSLENQSLKLVEIIVVDNGSTDNTSENIKKIFPKIKLIRLDKNTGVTGGRNTGISKVSKTSNYVFIFDHDMIADKNMLKNLALSYDVNANAGIITPKIYYKSDNKRIWSAGTGINLWTGQVLFRGGIDNGQYEEVAEVQVAPAAMLIKTTVLQKVKKFDDIYFGTYEDTEFCFKAREYGYKTYYCPTAIAYHDLSTDISDEYKRLLSRAFFVGRNRVIFMKRYGHSLLIFSLFLPIYALYYLKLAVVQNSISSWLKFLKGTLIGWKMK